ncbi:MAG TPA: hypothetical protein PLV68_21025, partial [Ilumatobacteraceae bacterium]|nr:hypothetical protein [Ilumatobacteraceae bacterium]
MRSLQRVVLRPGDTVTIGETTLSAVLHRTTGGTRVAGGHSIAFNRSPRLDPRYAGAELIAPDPPQRPGHQRFPLMTVIAPILMGAIMYSVTKNVLSILFVGLS